MNAQFDLNWRLQSNTTGLKKLKKLQKTKKFNIKKFNIKKFVVDEGRKECVNVNQQNNPIIGLSWLQLRTKTVES